MNGEMTFLNGWWFPYTESRPQKMYDGLMKYMNDMDFMVSLLPPKSHKRFTCVQAGGHIGMWPAKLSKSFAKVYTFEPDPPVADALARNMVAYPKVECRWAALGEEIGTVRLNFWSERTAVSKVGGSDGDMNADVPQITIDSLMLVDCKAIVLDIEGYEPHALRGAVETIKRYQPIVLCEMLPRSSKEITDTLAEMGYLPMDNPINHKCRDRIFTPGGKVP